MSAPFATPAPGRGRGRGLPRLRGGTTSTRGGGQLAHSSTHASPLAPADVDDDETDEVKDLRDKFGPKLAQTKEMFPEWEDDDILFALQEANGDLSVTILRISEGESRPYCGRRTRSTVG
jgi:hypothetical protein